MASSVELANRALTKVGASRITSLSDDVESARTVQAIWDTVRDSALRRANWNFAIKRASLPALIAAPDWGFDNQFQLPSDYLRVLQVSEFFPSSSTTDYRGASESWWKIEGGRILTSFGAPLAIRYVARITDTTLWDSLFCDYFASLLAYELCERLTQSNSKKEGLFRESRMALREASGSGAIENPPEALPDNAWVNARL